MSLSNLVIHKKKRGPPATGKAPLVALRLPETLGLRVDEWIATQPDPRPSRSEAIRRLLAQALGNQETAAVALELFAPTTSKSEDSYAQPFSRLRTKLRMTLMMVAIISMATRPECDKSQAHRPYRSSHLSILLITNCIG